MLSTYILSVIFGLFIFFLPYLFAIMPALKKPENLKGLSDYHLYAHRGLHNNASNVPENSLVAVRNAIQCNYGIEIDVQLTKDLVPVVFHDFNLKRICGIDARLSNFTWKEIQTFQLFHSGERIPSLAEVLEEVNGQIPIIIEFKQEEHSTQICEVSDKLLFSYSGEYCIESFNPIVLFWYRKNRPEIVRGQLSSDFMREGDSTPALFVIKHLLLNFLTKPNFIAYNCMYKNSLSRKLCHRLYKNLAVAWTIYSKEELDANSSSFDWFIFEGFLP